MRLSSRLELVPVVRPVEAHDLPQILDILNFEIANGFAHFGTDPMSLDALSREFQNAPDYPWLAALDGDTVQGFVRASPWKNRGGYRQTCEVGVYVRPDLQGRGIARLIYEALLPELRAKQFHTVLAGVALPNDASIRLHENFGFRHIGTQPQVGWKLGAWRDVGYWALVFDDISPIAYSLSLEPHGDE